MAAKYALVTGGAGYIGSNATRLVVDASPIRSAPGWQPCYDTLDVFVRTVLEWEKCCNA